MAKKTVLDRMIGSIAKKQQLFKKILIMALAGVLAAVPVIGTGCAEENMPSAVAETEGFEMTLEDYEAGVMNAYQALSQYLAIGDLLKAYIRSAYYLVNFEYISSELEEELIGKGYITENDMCDEDGMLTRDNPEGWMNIDNFRDLKNVINDYNQGLIHKDYIFGTLDMSHFIDLSVLCADEQDREAARQLFEKWFNGYNLKPGSLRDNESFREAHTQLTELNSAEKTWNPSVGARWFMLQTAGYDMMQFLRDYMASNFSYDELETYFVPEELRQGPQFYLRDDINIDVNNMSDLEAAVNYFAQEWNLCYDTVNNDMFAMLKSHEYTEDEYEEDEYEEEIEEIEDEDEDEE